MTDHRERFTERVTVNLRGETLEAPCIGTGPLVVALVSERGASITHRPSDWKVVTLGYDVETELERAVAVRDELLELDHDWTAADPTADVRPDVRERILAIRRREFDRFDEDDGLCQLLASRTEAAP